MRTMDYPRFSGSYVVKGLPAVNKENDLLVNKPIKSLSEISFLNERKNKKVIAKNRRPFEGKMRTHTSSLNLRMKLKVFIEELLSSCFNRLLKSTKELAFDSRLSFGQKDADLHFFLLMRFMLEYTRLSGRAFSEVSICLSVEAFHHVQVQISNYMESVVTMKKEAKHLGVRIQYSLSAYKELILFLQHVLDCGSSDEKDIAQRTLYHILIVEEYREMGLTMIRKFSPGFLSKTYLSELILSTHYYFRLLEKAVKTGRLNTVKKRSKIRRRTARRKKENVAPTSLPAVVDSLSPEDLSNKWSSIVKEIKDIVMGNLEFSSDQIPMNSLLDVQEEQHQKFAMLKVQRAMREGRTQDAMGLYRASRELWPTDGIFGDPNSSVDEQLVEIREIFFTDLKDVANELLNVELATQKKFSSDSMVEENDGRYYSDEEASEEDRFETKEVNFDFPEYVAKYARTDVLRWYVFLLNDFATNSFELNKALIKLLHRVAFDLNMPSRLFQLSLFRIFAQVGTHFKGMPKEDTKKNSLSELFTFGHHLLKKFFSCYGILGDKLAPEILFWKGPRECYEIQNGYGTYDASKNVKQVSAWSWDEELENELRSLYNEYRDMEERPEGMDLLDFIEPNLSRPRTRKQIFKKLKEFALDPLGAKAKKESITDRNFPIKQMKELIEEYNSIQGKEEDMVEFLRARLIGKQGEQFSRQKLIKQINHQGIVYEKKSTAKKSEWSELLKTELRGLKQQYDEMDEDDHELIDLVDYVMRRLSEKKPRRQVERELLALGVAINSRNKLKRIKGREVDQNTGTNEDYRNLGRQIDHKPGTNEDDGNLSSGRSDDSDAELELDIEEDCTSGGTNFMSSSVDDADKDDLIDSRISSAEKRNSIVPNDGDDEMENTNKESKTYESFLLSEGTNFESSSADTLCSYETTSSPIKSKGKRKRVLSTSDEDDNFEMESMDRVPPSSVSPTPLNKKKRVVVSDSDED